MVGLSDRQDLHDQSRALGRRRTDQESHLSKYLIVHDASVLVSDRRLLPDSLPHFQAFQDITLSLSDDGIPGPIVPGAVMRDGPRELSPDQPAPCETALLNGSYVHLLEVSIDRSETGYARNWLGFNKRRWERHKDEFQQFVHSATGATNDAGSASFTRHPPGQDRLPSPHREGNLGQPFRKLLSIHRTQTPLQDCRRDSYEHNRGTRRDLF